MKKPKCFYLYNDNHSLIDRLTNEQAGEVFKAIYRFADTGEKESSDDLIVETVVDVFTKHIERDYEAYNEKCEKMRQNAQKRYAKTDDSAIACKSSQEKDKEKDKEKEKYKEEEKEKKENKEQEEDKEKEEYKEKEREQKEEIKNSSLSDSLSSLIDYDSVMCSFNRNCVYLSKIDKMTDSRKKAVDNAAKLLGDITFNELFTRVQDSDFLSGKNGKWYGCSFDWILKPENLKKILSGAYDNPAPKPAPKTNPVPCNTSYDINELKKIDTLDFMDEPGWQEKAFNHSESSRGDDGAETGWDVPF